MSFRKWFKNKKRPEDVKFVEQQTNGHHNGGTNGVVITTPPYENGVGKKVVTFDAVNGKDHANQVHGNGNYQRADETSPMLTAADNNEKSSGKNDFLPLETALLLIADEQPLVARSTPRGQQINQWTEERKMRYCLFDKPVYDEMIEKSLKTVEMLQENLDDYVTEVRKSPSRGSTPLNRSFEK